MSNINPDEIKKRGEMLKRARQILVQEYTAMRSQQHQQWIKDSENSWKTNGVLIAYPPAKMYPTEQEVVNKALELYNRSLQPAVPLPDSSTIVEPTVTQAEDSKPTLLQDAQTPSITEQLRSAYNSPTETSIIDTGGVTEMPPTLPTITKVVQAGGDFVIIHEPIVLGDTEPVIEPEVKETKTEEPKTEKPVEEPKVEEPAEETNTEEPVAKHSLLRSVLSGWLSKNKDKDKS